MSAIHKNYVRQVLVTGANCKQVSHIMQGKYDSCE